MAAQFQYQPQQQHQQQQQQPQPQYHFSNPVYPAMNQYPPQYQYQAQHEAQYQPQYQAVPMASQFPIQGYRNFNPQPQHPVGYPMMPNPSYQVPTPGPVFYRPPPPIPHQQQYQQQQQRQPYQPAAGYPVIQQQQQPPPPPASAIRAPVRRVNSRPQRAILGSTSPSRTRTSRSSAPTSNASLQGPPLPQENQPEAITRRVMTGQETSNSRTQMAAVNQAAPPPPALDPEPACINPVLLTRVKSPSPLQPEPMLIDLTTTDDDEFDQLPTLVERPSVSPLLPAVAEQSLSPREATQSGVAASIFQLPPTPPAPAPRDVAPAAEAPATKIKPLHIRRDYAWLRQAAPGAEVPGAKRRKLSPREMACREDYDQKQSNATAAHFLGLKATQPAPALSMMNSGASSASSSDRAVESSSSGSGAGVQPKKKGRKGKERAKSPVADVQEKEVGEGVKGRKKALAKKGELKEKEVEEEDKRDNDELAAEIEAMFDEEEAGEEDERDNDRLAAEIEAMFDDEEAGEDVGDEKEDKGLGNDDSDDDMAAQIEAMYDNEGDKEDVKEKKSNEDDNMTADRDSLFGDDDDEKEELEGPAWTELVVIENPVPGQNN